jgi:hypothetical protein
VIIAVVMQPHALEARCTTFASFDEPQRKCATLAGLTVILAPPGQEALERPS